MTSDDVRMAAERLIQEMVVDFAESSCPYDLATGQNSELLAADKDLVLRAYLAELDPSEITAERLEADGWERRGRDAFKNGGATLFDAPDHNAMNSWFLASPKAAMACNVSTMGHVRTLLRLAKEVR